mmetsp:Transcript_29426/g.53999  ORF Transcript_29426/g.53999 Transcript_29426/m.53999 type:complete len:329 (-) Transcript_29426:1086-2072(-)|eukprot:CAMPEP_0175080276 /NCGR_PEP_ID=MMETSP0052_2-20121109/25402_1 /TAXON_ID=51329 ORGANISM="Polytomella parva, Strain SAG 63-3" /NCGR_SAMPLE_ID=MMETSP0052_2 /ASSEMBLY_ACC=CAM_ASM_000194 /LENGTH=328 /DNA_ID=CAMNT_0016350927 /DNA_START=71 /DNA_END=1057 /DNA_ORIENTATION=-
MSESSTFRFNFISKDDDVKSEAKEDEYKARAEEVPYHSSGDYYEFEYLTISGVQLLRGKITSETAASALSDERLTKSDLVAGRYEGGFKLWECAIDLCKFLIESFNLSEDNFQKKSPNGLTGKRVLELGCGHGLPGIVALLAGASIVDFQDYNHEVLKKLTIPNVMHNVRTRSGANPSLANNVADSNPNTHLSNSFHFTPFTSPLVGSGSTHYFSGDWGAVGELLTMRGLGGAYDVILAAETIYNPQTARRFLEIIKQLLQPPRGVAYVAAKKYYFGVGGGTDSFSKMVKEDGLFEISTVAEVKETTGGNVRLILKLTFPDSICPYFL